MFNAEILRLFGVVLPKVQGRKRPRCARNLRPDASKVVPSSHFGFPYFHYRRLSGYLCYNTRVLSGGRAKTAVLDNNSSREK